MDLFGWLCHLLDRQSGIRAEQECKGSLVGCQVCVQPVDLYQLICLHTCQLSLEIRHLFLEFAFLVDLSD